MRGKESFGVRILCYFVFFLCCTYTASALPTITKLQEVKGQCVSDCGIIVHAANLGSNVKYGLINYPTPGQTRTQDENEFTNLEPGTYTVGVYDNTTGDSPVVAVITISTSYNEMFLSAPTVGNDPNNGCVDNGTLSISFTGGRAPFRYKIMGPVTREVVGQTASTYKFTGLPSGNYTVEVQDACDQWRRNKPESPVVVASSANPYKDLSFQTLTITRNNSSTYFSASRNVCNQIYLHRLHNTDAKILLSNGTIVNGNNSTLKYYIESPANSGVWSTSPISGGTSMYFYNIPYSSDNRTYRIKVVHPCIEGDEAISDVLTFPDEPTSFVVYSNGNSGSYTDYCTINDNPSVNIRISYSGNSIIRDFGCGTYKYTLKKDGVPVVNVNNPQTLTTTTVTFGKAHGLVGGQAYTVDIEKNGVFVQSVPFTTGAVPSAATPSTYYYHTYNSNTAGYNYGRTCDFEHTRVYAYRSNTTSGLGSVKYTIISGPSGVDISAFPERTTTSYGQVLWDNVPYGTYRIKEEWAGCPAVEKDISIAQELKSFGADDPTHPEDPNICGMYTLRGQGYYIKPDGTKHNIANQYLYYYMQIVEGPLRSDGKPTVGLRSALTYPSSSYYATIANLPGGNYKVIFYSRYAAVSSTGSGDNLRYGIPNCHYVEKEVEIRPYILPKLDIPMSGGISCSPTGGNATLTITGKGDPEKTPYLYRYKAKGAPDTDYYPADFSETNKYYGLNTGEYTVQILDQCGNIGTQDVTIYNSGDQIIEIIGGVDDGSNNTVICRGQTVTLQVKSIGPVKSYQWFKGPSISGPWTALTDEGDHYFYKIENVVDSDAGHYRVVIDNTTCTISSSVHIVGVNDPAPTPIITGPEKICLGTTFKLQAHTDVSPVTYQWFRNGELILDASGSEYQTTVTGSYTVVINPTVGCPSNPSAAHIVQSDPDACVEANNDLYEMNVCDGTQYIDVTDNDKTASCPVDITIVTPPSYGNADVVTHDGKKKIKYTPTLASYTKRDALTYKISCGSDESNVATVEIKLNSLLKIVKIEDANEPNKKGKFRISYTCDGVKYNKDLAITYEVVGGSAVSGSDYIPLTGTITLYQNQTSVDLEVTPKDNYKVEGNTRDIEVKITNVAEIP